MKTENNSLHVCSLADSAYDYFGEYLLQSETEDILAEIEKEKAEGKTAEMDAFLERQEKEYQRQIQKYFRQEKAKEFFTVFLPKSARIAALVLVLLVVCSGVVIATNSTVQVKMMRLVGKTYTQYTAFKVEEDPEASFEVPVEWHGDNYLSWVPDDLQIDRIVSSPVENFVEYRDKNTNNLALYFFEMHITSQYHIDTENAEVTNLKINGYDAVLSSKKKRHTITWFDGKHIFEVVTKNRTKEETIKIAENVKPIRLENTVINGE